MNSKAYALVLAAIIGATSISTTDTASAQVNCNVLPHGQARASCYGREAQIWRQQSDAYNAIARQQYGQHEQIGQALRYAPLIGRYAAPAWNAPRYYYTYRYGRP